MPAHADRRSVVVVAVAVLAGTSTMARLAHRAGDGPRAGDTSSAVRSTEARPRGAAGAVPGEPLPGAPPLSPELTAKLQVKWAAREPAYEPRTRHLHADGSPKYTNRLFLESSPYLLQHAHNPVDWYPWGDEPFETARRLGRPVLLSVGYSTCHWCHVMEEESFDDEEIARYINENYVIVKVDREERPDVDAIYMSAVQRMTGDGGWPMTVWVTPDRKPFFGGTYFPARDGDRGARVGFLSLLRQLKEAYGAQADKVAEVSTRLAEAIRADLAPRSAAAPMPGPSVLESAASYYRSRFDSTEGGLAGAPKFPSSLPIRFLLRFHRRAQDAEALHLATLTLEKMAGGGMYDHVGGGFRRYSTDERWLVPHFEKMLYDNALLAVAYLEAFQATGEALYARVVEETLDYVLREMTSPEGPFFSSQDADSEGVEGKFYVWSAAEIEDMLGKDLADLFGEVYDVTPSGNWEGHNILNQAKTLDQYARLRKIPEAELRASLAQAKKKLLEARSRRVWPGRDEKVLTAWNGLMIDALAQAGMVLEKPAYCDAAARAADFIWSRMRRPDGRLLRTYMAGSEPKLNAYLEDYAFLLNAQVSLYEATHAPHWIERALNLADVMIEQFWDSAGGGFFFTGRDHESLISRTKDVHDSSIPSGNSMAVTALLRLAKLTGKPAFREKADSTLRLFHEPMTASPIAAGQMLVALDFHLGPVQ